MLRFLAAAGFLLLAINGVHAGPYPVVANDVGVCDPNNPLHCLAPDASGNLPVTGTFSATLSGFTPNGSFATLTAAGTSGSVALPAGTTVAFQNTGTTTVSCTLGVGSATATANEIQVPASSTVFVTPGSNTFGACIDQSGTTSNTVVLAGGTGLGTGFGGGGGGGGGGGAITAAANSYAAGAFSAGAGVDGWDLTQGAKTDAACAGDNTSGCSVEGRLQRIAQNITTLNTTAGNPIPGGTNTIGSVKQTDGTTVVITDPCQGVAKTYTPINISASGSVKIITGAAAKKTYICHIDLVTNTANNVALVEGTGTNCATGTSGVIGGTTPASGWNFSANGGISIGMGGAAALQAPNATGDDVCLNPSAATQLSGQVVWVQQ